MTCQEIRDILADQGIHPSAIEQNPATDGEWVVWYGMGYPVYTIEDVQELAGELS